MSGSNHNTRTRTRTSLPLTHKLPNSLPNKSCKIQCKHVARAKRWLQETATLERNLECFLCVLFFVSTTTTGTTTTGTTTTGTTTTGTTPTGTTPVQEDCQQLNQQLECTTSTRASWQLAKDSLRDSQTNNLLQATGRPCALLRTYVHTYLPLHTHIGLFLKFLKKYCWLSSYLRLFKVNIQVFCT